MTPSSAGDALGSLQNLLRSFTAFDWLITLIAAWSTLRGLLRGIIRELFALAGLLLGILVAAWYYSPLAVRLEPWVPQPAVAVLLAFVLVALAVSLVVMLLGRLVRSAAHLVGLGIFDRLSGALFGFLRACLLGAAILMACSAFLPPQPALRDSRLAPDLLRVAHALAFLAPADLQQRLAAGISQLHNADSPAR